MSVGVSRAMKGRASLLALSLLAIPSAALAQQFTSTESIRALFRQGYCAVRSAPEDARKLFATPPGSKEEAKLIRTLGAQLCGYIGFGFPSLESNPQLLRGVIAEAVLDDSRTKKGKIDPATAPFGNLSLQAIGALDAKGQASLAGLDFAQCIVAASPDGVRKLLNTNPTWDSQDKAIQQLQPYLGPCLPKGAEVSFSKLVLRGLLAEAAYRSLYFTTVAGKN